MAPNKRRRSTRNVGGAKTTQRAISNVVRSVLLSKSEIKYSVQTVGLTTSSTAGQVQNLSQGITEGNELNQRSGRQIVLTKMDFRLTVNLPTAAVTGNLRCIIFADGMNLGVTPAVIDVLNTAAVTSAYSSNQAQERRFRILYDHIYPMVVGGSDQQIAISRVIKCGLKISYTGPNNLTAANGRNAIFALFITDNGVVSPIYNYDLAFHYLDL